MTTTILAAFALTGVLTPVAAPAPSVQTDYARALKLAATEQKPMAVLIGTGDSFAKLLSDASLTAETKKAIGEKFVCVSVNIDTPAGKELAEQFQMNSGLVISTTGGAYQSVRQAGTVSATDFAKHTGTLTSAPVATATPTIVCANGTCSLTTSGATATCATGNCALSGVSSCASGNCGTATVSGCASGTCGGTAVPARGGIFRRR